MRKTIESEPSTVALLELAAEIFISCEADETALTKICGFQPSLFTETYAWIVAAGVAKIISVFAPEPFRDEICELTSVAVASKPCVETIALPSGASPPRSPASSSLP